MKRQEQHIRVFKQFDKNGDGKISPAELQQCVGSIGGEMTVKEVEAAMLLMDSDGDGLLCVDDLVNIVEGAGEDEKVSDLKETFKKYEEMEGSESGCITPKSLKRMLSRLGQRRSIEDCKIMIDHFDLNGDGVLSFDEFKLMMS